MPKSVETRPNLTTETLYRTLSLHLQVSGRSCSLLKGSFRDYFEQAAHMMLSDNRCPWAMEWVAGLQVGNALVKGKWGREREG